MNLLRTHGQRTVAYDELRRRMNIHATEVALPCVVMFVVVLAILVCMAYCYRPWQQLRQLEHQRVVQHDRLQKVRAELEQRKQEYVWLINDYEYFEMRVADRNDLARPGERILRVLDKADAPR